VVFDFPGPFGLREPGTCGYGSRSQLGSAQVQWLQTRFFADKAAA
jgi:hypothetical protein